MRFSIPKTLILKEGAPVILLKNLPCGLLNGQRGTVHKLSDGKSSIINFNGKPHDMKTKRFEVFDATQTKILASRIQIILVILAFAVNVHSARDRQLKS